MGSPARAARPHHQVCDGVGDQRVGHNGSCRGPASCSTNLISKPAPFAENDPFGGGLDEPPPLTRADQIARTFSAFDLPVLRSWPRS